MKPLYRTSSKKNRKPLTILIAVIAVIFLINSFFSKEDNGKSPQSNISTTTVNSITEGSEKQGELTLVPENKPADLIVMASNEPLVLVAPTADKISLTAKSAILIDETTGTILYAKDIHTEREIASLTKILTGYLVAEELNLKDVITVSDKSALTGGSELYLNPGEKVKAKDMIYGLMLRSANDGAVALAEHLTGSEANFVKKMNQEVSALGLENTKFFNPHGLNKNVSTAFDMAIISQKALSNDLFRKIVSTRSYEIPWPGNLYPRSAINHNRLITQYPYVKGIKTGFTDASGYCLAASAEKNGIRLISVTLGAPSPDARNVDTMKLLDYGFESYESKEFFNLTKNKIKPIVLDTYPPKEIKPISQVELTSISLKGDTSAKMHFFVDKEIELPVEAGEVIGELSVVSGKRQLGSVPIRSMTEVKPPTLLSKIGYFFSSIF